MNTPCICPRPLPPSMTVTVPRRRQKAGFPDYCHDNKLVQGKARNGIVPPFAIIWFCDPKNVRQTQTCLPGYLIKMTAFSLLRDRRARRSRTAAETRK